MNLTGEDGEQALALRDCILRHCFRELDTMDEHEWEHQMCCALKWPDDPVDERGGDLERGVADLVHNGFQGRG